MKKALSVLLAVILVIGTLTLAACGSSDSGGKKEQKVDEKNLSFTTVGELKSAGTEYDFIAAERKLEDDAAVCVIKADAEGEITVPAQYDGKDVAAVISESQSSDRLTSLTLENGVSYIENCFTESSSVQALTLPASVKGVYHSFNSNSALREVSFPTSVKYIVGSFCSCSALAGSLAAFMITENRPM